jgi:GNAT superfamily N-acetyltransferase
MRDNRPPLELVPVNGSRLDRAFVDLPYRLYDGDPFWVPPLRREELRRWRLASNPSLGPRWTSRFLALRNGRPVGRIAAIHDSDFAARWSPDTGLFGFYECADDAPAARALLSAAETALAQRGVRTVLGPVNLTFHDETGLLVEGFDSTPMILSPYNPPRYSRQLEDEGYRPGREYLSYRWTPAAPRSAVVDRLVRAAQRGQGPAAGVRVRALDPARWRDEVRLAWTIYCESFAEVWGNTPLTWEEFSARSDRFRPFLVPELALFAERDGEAVAFSLTLPDVNRALQCARGRLFPFGWVRLQRAAARIRAARFAILGVKPDERSRGIAGLLAWETACAAQRLGYELLELSLVLSDNRPIQHVIDAFGAEPWKRYRLYGKTLCEAAV